MIKYNNSNISDWNFDDSNIIKVYHNGAVCYYKLTSGDTPTPVQEPCFAVVDDITQYQETEFEDVFNQADEKWYKLNNLSQYEKYGVYGSGRTITTYEGKLTIDDGYEYQYSGGSWINVGEVSGSTATLPDIPFVLNYNAANYDATTHSIPMTSGQLNDTDAVAYNNPNSIVDHSQDGYITISNASMRIRKVGQDISLFNRSSNSTSSDLTIVCKALTRSDCNIITNRDSDYNWMYRQYSDNLTFHGNMQTGSISCSSSNPDILSVRTYYDSNTKVKYNNWTQNTSTTPIDFTYGSTNSDSSNAGALFVGYSWSDTSEQWSGDFYWVYMSQNTLTDEQIQQVITYNEGGRQTEYPVYYDELQDPPNNVTFTSMTEAESYECPWVGMIATIDGVKYIFSGDSISGYEWVEHSGRLPQGYTEVEYIRQNSNYNAYINTSVIPYDNTSNRFTVTAKVKSEYHSNLACATIIACEEVNSPYYGFGYRYRCSVQQDVLEFFGADNTVSKTSAATSDSAVTVTFTKTADSSKTMDVPLYIFGACGNASYTSATRYSDSTLYSMSVVKNNETVREFVPAKRDSDSVYGLYDLITDAFYTSPNGNNFIGGQPV